MTPTSFPDLDDLLKAAPLDLGATDWTTLDQQAIAAFANSTSTPATGGTAPPLMILSVTNRLLPLLFEVPGAASGVNYGAGSVRFGPAVRAGDRIRARASLLESSEVAGGVQTLVEIRIEVEGEDSAACVVEAISRWLR